MGKRKKKSQRPGTSGLTPGRRFFRNALWLVAVNLFMRTVGVGFNLRISEQAGGEVMGLYALLGGVYGLFLTLGCGSIHLGTTRLVAEVCAMPGEDRRAALRRCLVRCLSYALLCGAGAGLVLFIASPWIGRVWLGDERTVSSLRVMALSLPPIALSNALAGYFTAVRRVRRQSVCGVVTQFCRLFLCIRLMAEFVPRGVEAACMALTLGGVLSEGIGLVLSLGAYAIDRTRHPEGAVQCRDADGHGEQASGGRPAQDGSAHGRGLTARLLGITVPVTLAACLRSGLVTLEHALIPRGLRKSGASWAASLASYGLLHSLVLPVVLFPSAFISSFSGLIVPEVAESRAKGDCGTPTARVARISSKIITPALLFSIGVAGIMSCFAYEIGACACHSAEAGRYIRLLAPLIPIMYVDSSVDAVLKGMGEQVYSMVVNIIDALTSVILVLVLLPRMGLNGYIITIYVTETLNTTLSLCRMLTVSRMPVRLWRTVFAPLASIIGAASFMRLCLALLPDVLPGIPGLCVHIGLTAGLYVLFLLLTGAVPPLRRRTKAAD